MWWWSKKYWEHLGLQGDCWGRRGDTWWIFPTFCHQDTTNIQSSSCILSVGGSVKPVHPVQKDRKSSLVTECLFSTYRLGGIILWHISAYYKIIAKYMMGTLWWSILLYLRKSENHPMRGLTLDLEWPPGRPMGSGAARTNQWEGRIPEWPPERPMTGTRERQWIAW